MDSPDKQHPTASNQPVPPVSGSRRRRGRRGGRGRNRGHRQPAHTVQTEPSVGAPIERQTSPELEVPAAAESGNESSAMSRAIDEVRQIVESLEQVLEQMEEVHELVETAERQKFADEREIASLHRALRRVQTPRGHKATPHEHGSDQD